MGFFASPQFHYNVVFVLDLLVLIVAIVLGAVAFVHCLTQRADAFPAIGTLPKGAWLAIIGVFMLLSLLIGLQYVLFPMVLIGSGMIYMLDVRVGLRDLSDGKGFW